MLTCHPVTSARWFWAGTRWGGWSVSDLRLCRRSLTHVFCKEGQDTCWFFHSACIRTVNETPASRFRERGHCFYFNLNVTGLVSTDSLLPGSHTRASALCSPRERGQRNLCSPLPVRPATRPSTSHSVLIGLSVSGSMKENTSSSSGIRGSMASCSPAVGRVRRSGPVGPSGESGAVLSPCLAPPWMGQVSAGRGSAPRTIPPDWGIPGPASSR